MSFLKLLMAVPDSAVTMKNLLQLNVPGNQFDVEGLDKIVGDMIDGSLLSFTKLSTGALQAAATVTFNGNPNAAESIVVANLTFTAVAGSPSAFEFQIGGSAAATAANFAAVINATPEIAGIVQATVLSQVVTLTSVQPGKSGNGLQATETLTNVDLVLFANGSDGDQVAINFGQSA